MSILRSLPIAVPTVLIVIFLIVFAGIGFSLSNLVLMIPWVATFTAVQRTYSLHCASVANTQFGHRRVALHGQVCRYCEVFCHRLPR
jgi:hypothetical protein